MRTIILAAGISRRLGALTENIPKCLLQIGRERLLRRIIRACALVSLKSVVIITGHGSKYVDGEIESIAHTRWAQRLQLQCLYNPSYAVMNNCYSLLLGLPKDKQDVVIVNSDDVFDSRILKRIARAGRTLLVVDNIKQLTKESMKVYVEANRISRIGKMLDLHDSAGEYIGLARIASDDVVLLRRALEEVVANRPDGFYEHGFDIMIDKTEVSPSYTNGLRWTEVDTVEDLAHAREMVEKGLIK
jgi:choline kinase